MAIFKTRIRRMWTRIRRMRRTWRTQQIRPIRQIWRIPRIQRTRRIRRTRRIQRIWRIRRIGLKGSLKGFSVSFTLLLKVLYVLVSYPLSYTWLKRDSQII